MLTPSWPRDLVAVCAVSVALVLQVSVLDQVAWHGVVPDLVLLVVVATALAHGTEYAMVVGLVGGLLLDLAPPADHVAGRWALALVLVGYVAGRLAAGETDRGRVSVSGAAHPPATRGHALAERRVAVVVLAAASSFVGTSAFALSGMVLHDHAVGVPDLLRVVATALAWDAALALVVVPLVLGAFARVRPGRLLVG